MLGQTKSQAAGSQLMSAIVKHFTVDTILYYNLQLLCQRYQAGRWEGRGGGREGFHLKFNAGDSKAHLALAPACSVQTIDYSTELFREHSGAVVEVVTLLVLV